MTPEPRPIRGVLVTGMSGVIGGAVRERLAGAYTLSALNRRPVEGVPTLQADIGDFDAIRPAFAGVDAVVHLAADTGRDNRWDGMLHTNVAGTRNVFEAAREAGVRRIVFASSSATTGFYERGEPLKAIMEGRYEDAPAQWPRIRHDSPVRPRSIYACTKIWGEALGRYYAEAFGLSVLCLRFGHVTREDRPVNLPNDYSIWCSRRDAAQAVQRCLEAPPDLRFDILYVTSANARGVRDIDHARQVLGYAPQDSADEYRLPS